MPQSPSVWDDADALLATPVTAPKTPSVWAEADAVLGAPPAAPKPRAAATLPAGAITLGTRTTPRPPPFQVGGVTDPDSVRVTDPVRPAPVPVDAAGTPLPQYKPPIGDTRNVWDPVGAMQQIGSSAAELATKIPQNIRAALRSVGGQAPWLTDAEKNAASAGIESLFELTKPLMLIGAATAPVKGVLGLAATTGASKATHAFVTANGGSESDARLAATVAGLLAAGLSADDIIKAGNDGVAAVARKAQTTGRELTLAAKLSGSGFGTGDVPGFRGAPIVDTLAGGAPELADTRGAAERGFTEGAKAPVTNVWKEADAVLQTPPAAAEPTDVQPPDLETLAPTRQELVKRTIAEGQAAGVPDNATAQRLEQERTGAPAAGTLTDTTKGAIDALLQENPADVARTANEAPGAPVGANAGAPPVDVSAGEVATPVPAAAESASAEAVRAKPDAEVAHEFASTQVQLPADVAAELKALGAKIPDAHLAQDGRENDAHVTVKFGLHDTDPDAVRRALAGEGPITATLGKTSIFPNGESNAGDVVKVDVASPDLHRLNAKIAALPHTDTHPDYKPHATIAYVKPGLGAQYADDASVAGRQMTIDHVVLSGQKGERIVIPLTGAAAPASATVEGAADDTTAREGQQPADDRTQRPDVAGTGPLESRIDRPGPAARRRAAEADRRGREAEALDQLVAQAQTEGYTGHPAALRAEVADRLQLLKDLDAEFADSDRSPDRLLQEVARHGGLSVKRESALQGELRWLKEFQDNVGTHLRPRGAFGTVRGVRGVFRERGKSVDDMLTALQQNGEFGHLGSVSEFLDELQHAATAHHPAAAVERLVRGLGDRWWEHVGHGHDVVAEEESDAAEPDHELEAAAMAFDPEELETQGLTHEDKRIRPAGTGAAADDVLDSGEHQARLPEAGAVREAEHAPPEFDAPFSLTSEAEDARGTQDSLFKAEKPTFGKKPRGGGSGAMVIPSKPKAPVKATSSNGILHAEVVPGADKFVERDVVPGMKKVADELLKLRADVHAVWSPDTVSEPAETQAALMRAELGARRQRTARVQHVMRDFETAWDKIPLGTKDDAPSAGTQLAFAMAVDEGRVAELPEWQRGVATLFKEINDKKRDEIVAWKGLRNWLEHYYPREWVKPGKVVEFIRRAAFGKRPLQGRASFRKARARDDAGNIIPFRDYLTAGYTPVEPNPVRAHLRKWLEMDKWLAARKILERGKTYGTAEFVPIGKEKPDGYDFYDESFGTVYGPPTMIVREAYDAVLMQGLSDLMASLNVGHERKVNIGGGAWGLAYGDTRIKTKFGGDLTVIEHELGHILDERYGLRGGAIDVKDKRFRQELRDLADLREEGTPATELPPSRRRYLRKGQEKIANLVHAFLYNPERTKEVAPNSYWALYNLAKDHAELRPLLKLQKTKSLKLESNSAEVRINGLPPVIGRYAGPPDAVRLLNRALSSGLRRYRAFNLYRGAGNVLNQVQLGLSGFHLVGTSLNAGLSHAAIALEHGTRGNWKDAARHGGLSALGPLASLRDVVIGHKLLKDYYAKDANFRSLVDVADGVARGGGSVTWDTFWHQSAPERFMQALRSVGAEAKAGNYPGAAVRAAALPWRALTAAIEGQAKPIMEWWVPRLKLAAYWDLYRMELADLGEIPNELELQKAAGRAWRSVDNRFGELVYDNLFWHAALKDAGMATVRSLGWNVGTIDEVFGALPAQARQLGALPGAGGFGPPKRLRHTGFKIDEATGERMPVYEQGRAPLLTHKFAYLVALAFYSAIFGALYQYFHTGLTPGEQEDGSHELSTALLDFYFPRTGGVTFDGRPERASLPTYVKDVYAFTRHPIETARGKLNPLLSLASDVIANSDYFGNALRDPQASLPRRVADTFDYIAHEYRPISLSSYFERQKNRKGGAISLAESFLGINVAPASVTRTALENYLHELQPARPRTKEEADRATAKRSVRELLSEGKKPAARDAAREAGLSGRGVQQMARAQRLSSLQRSFQATSLTDAIRGYELATPEERGQIKRLLERKAGNAQIPPAQREDVRRRLREALALPTVGKIT